MWVPTPGVDNPRQSALSCIRACQAYGVPAHATPWRTVLWDLETGTEPDPPWFAAARTVMEAHGYASMSYGSSGWAFGEPNYLGLIIALPGTSFTLDQVRSAHVGHLIAGIQDRFGVQVPGGVIDTDQLDAAWLPHLGHLKLG